MKFEIIHTDPNSNARSGTIDISRGRIDTPVFMPVGTLGTVKTVPQSDLISMVRAQIILANTYHLYLRPGTDIIRNAGGIHGFINWDKPLLTDSGGYQIYSLSKIRKIESGGVTFYSHIDGSKHHLTPREAILTQRELGADIIMAFDECTPYPCDYKYARDSMNLTHRWLDESIDAFEKSSHFYDHPQILAPIVQGSVFGDLRVQSAEYVSGKNAPINAIGGLSVGEPAAEMYNMVDAICGILPKDKPRYLMGVGTPENMLHCIALGVDMFDCVLPTRNARHGLLYTEEGSVNIRNKKWANDHSPIDPGSDCSFSNNYTRAYLRHLFASREWLGPQIASMHNLRFYTRLMEQAREHIRKGQFSTWMQKMLKKLPIRL